jgi:type II protein arginine methyltransferase
MYRQTDNRKVWYEWMVEVFRLERTSPTPAAASPQRSTTPIMMSGGIKAVPTTTNKTQSGYKRIRVGMSEMHSSIKDGCLM